MVRGPTVSLGAVGPREFDFVTPAAQHNVLLCVLWEYGSNDPTIPDKVQLLCGICLGLVCTQIYTGVHYIHTYMMSCIHTCVEYNIVNAVNEKCDVAS